MRKTLLSFSLLLFTAIAAFAQAPQLFNYQGVARTAGGSPLANQTISLRLTIHDVSAAGTVLYQESHTVTTNPFGLYVVSVGNGTNTTGTFSSITWGTNDKYMQVEVDPAGGSSFATLGATQLLSVPYAVYSNTAGTATNALNFTGNVNMSGDVTGTNVAANVVKLQGRNLSPAAPTSGEVLAWNSITNDWEPSLAGAGSGTVSSITAGPGLTASTNPITTTGTIDLPFVGTSGTYGSATQVPVFNTDAYGRVTSVTNTTITTSSASGTVNYISKFTAPTSLGNSEVYDNGTSVGVGTITPDAQLHISGSTDITTTLGGTLVFGHQALLAQTSTTATAQTANAIIGYSDNSSLENHGLFGGANGSGASYNVGAFCWANPIATTGNCYGVYGSASGGFNNIGVYGTSFGTGWAGYFDGDVDVIGMITKGSGTFKIDDPLDPENKYLYHSFVESPDMMNIYNGNIITDASGVAVVALPAYFDALNKDFRYQLTVIGTFAQAIVSKEISGNEFEIKTSVPNVKVSWQVTGVRQDKFANAHRVVPEVEKEAKFKGYYLYPKEYGQPVNKGISTLLSPKTAKENNSSIK